MPVGVASPPLSPQAPQCEGINPVLPEETVMVFTETVTMQDDAECPQDLPLLPLFASRSITRHKSQQAPKGEVQSVTHKELHYTSKELLESSNLHSQKSREYVWEWIIGVRDNGRRNVKLNQAEFTDMGSLSRESASIVAAWGVRKGSNSLFG